MRLSDFDYDLPDERIALAPARPRDSARLLYMGTALDDLHVSDLPRLLRPGDRLVVNDTKVIPAQLTAMRGAAKIGITLDKRQDDDSWRVLLRNAKRVKTGDTLEIDDGFSAQVEELYDGGAARLRFIAPNFRAALDRAGALALPPYIARPEGITAQDKSDYQTLFANHEGAVAAPTAGLHFTPQLLAALEQSGVALTRVTLHVGAGTFLPVRTEDLTQHKMHSERGIITPQAAAQINATRTAGGRIVPVGTTALRVLESAATTDGVVHDFAADTDIFITPGYQFKVADLLMTNFHLPKSTLLMLVSAFAGVERIRTAYAHAIAEKYRFYSYGDACLLERG